MGEVKDAFLRKYTVGRSMVSFDAFSIFYDMLTIMPRYGRALDIGTCLGHTATFFATLKPQWTIYTVDYFDLFPLKNIQTDQFNRKVNERDRSTLFTDLCYGYTNIIPIVHDTKTLPWELPVDFIFIDADHSYEGVKHDFERFSPFLKDFGKIAFHDYGIDREGFGVTRFIDELKGWKKEVVHDVAVIWK